jgi:hypothetical protein
VIQNVGSWEQVPASEWYSRLLFGEQRHMLYHICSMTVLKAHFDGKVLVPDEPVDLPRNCALELHVKELIKAPEHDKTPLQRLAEALQQYPDNPSWPDDGAAQLDHYLYGTTKRP